MLVYVNIILVCVVDFEVGKYLLFCVVWIIEFCKLVVCIKFLYIVVLLNCWMYNVL